MPDSRTKDPVCTYVERVGQTLLAIGFLYEPAESIRWLNSPQPMLNNNRPAELLQTDEGTARINQLIAQLRDGAFV